jgi:hypothetical protein
LIPGRHSIDPELMEVLMRGDGSEKGSGDGFGKYDE